MQSSLQNSTSRDSFSGYLSEQLSRILFPLDTKQTEQQGKPSASLEGLPSPVGGLPGTSASPTADRILGQVSLQVMDTAVITSVSDTSQVTQPVDVAGLQTSSPALPCPALPCPALPCPALPCPALPCPAPPCPEVTVMGSIHYPALTSVAPLPAPPSRRGSLASSQHSGRRPPMPSTGASTPKARPRSRSEVRVRVRDAPTNRKRNTLPAIPRPPEDDVNVTSSRRRHSMTEVVARMHAREKTLLGEDLLRARDSAVGTAGGRLQATHAGPALSGQESGHTSLGEPPPHPHPQESVVRRKYGTWEIPKAWQTPRDSDQKRPDLGSPGDLKASTELGVVTGQDVCDAERGSQGQTAGDSAEFLESGTGDQSENRGDGAKADEDEEEEEDFDFDEGEEEVAAQRERHRKSGATEAVYLRACQILSIQPSPAFLRQCHLAVMDLRDVRLGPADVKPIAIALVRDGRVCVLDLSNNDLGPVGVSYVAEMLQENSTLTDLNLSATSPGRQGVRALCETLRHNRTLAFLRLEENSIEHTESHLLADLIRSVPTLQGLFLGHNRLGYWGGAAIASALAQNSSLKTLDLQWNHIRRDSAVTLVRALETNSCLKTLNLAWNGLGKEGCLALAHALPKNSSLRELDMTCNRVDLMSLSFLLQGLLRNVSLHTLRIGQNPLTTEGAKCLISAVAATPRVSICNIDIAGVPVDMEFTQMLARAQESRDLRVNHEEAVTLATSDRKREHEGNNLDRFDPVMVLFEYMKLDNLRVIDMFQFMDTKKKDKLSKANIRDGLNTLKLPVTEHAIDIIFDKLDINKDGFVELDEMMKVQRDTARQVKLRQIKAKAKKKEDGGLAGLHKTLRDIIAKRKEEKEPRRDVTQNVTTTKTSGGGRKVSLGGLQLTQARYSVTSSKRRGEEDTQALTSVEDDES